MNRLTETWIKLANYCRNTNRGQTMAEYAIIVSVVAIVVWISYQAMGNDLGSMVSYLDNKLVAAT